MESVSGVSGEKELNENGTPVEILEGDEDNTMISSLRSELVRGHVFPLSVICERDWIR